MNIKQDIILRVRIMFLFILLFTMGILWRIFKLQVVEGAEWRSKASKAYVKERKIPAVRGNIYSDDGSLLATSLPKYRVGFDPIVGKRNKKTIKIYQEGIDSLCMLLSSFYKVKDKQHYLDMINDARKDRLSYIILDKKLVDFQDVKLMKTWPIFRNGKYKGGVVFEKVNVRFTPFGKMGYRTIGYKKDLESVGIENSFDSLLAGTDGKGVFEKIAGGSWRPIEGNNENNPIPGLDIQTTLDVNIQDVAETSLLKALQYYNADKGCVVVMDVKTGEIKAMTNLSKSNMKFSSMTGYVENYNHAVLGRTDPGSIFKLPSMMAMMEKGGLKPTEMVNTGNGTFTIGKASISDSRGHKHGFMTAQDVFETSSNVGVMRLMQKYFSKNKSKYYDYLHQFRLDSRLNFQLRPDALPVIKRPQKGDQAGMYWHSVGYGQMVTPLQMLTFYNAIANDGFWIQPIIVKCTKKADEVVYDFAKDQRKSKEMICTPSTLKYAKAMLEGVVERGTAHNVKNELYKIAGKTGTAVRIVNGRYQKDKYTTSFVGYFPAESPKYSCVVMIDNAAGASNLTNASQVSAPVFKEIADKIFACDIKMHKIIDTISSSPIPLTNQKVVTTSYDMKILFDGFGIKQIPESEGWFRASNDNDKIEFKEIQIFKNKVPDLHGMTLRDALYILENKGFKVKYQGLGKVVKQSVAPNTLCQKNKYISLILK